LADDRSTPAGWEASDKIAGVDHPRVKIQHGRDGEAYDASDDNALPTRGAVIDDVYLMQSDSAAGAATPINERGFYLFRAQGDFSGGTVVLEEQGKLDSTLWITRSTLENQADAKLVMISRSDVVRARPTGSAPSGITAWLAFHGD